MLFDLEKVNNHDLLFFLLQFRRCFLGFLMCKVTPRLVNNVYCGF